MNRSQAVLNDHSELAERRRSLAQSADLAALAYVWPFGRHKGKHIVSVPATYLKWMRRNSNNLNIVKRSAEELERRNRLANSRQGLC